jgi:hypothetical protein
VVRPVPIALTAITGGTAVAALNLTLYVDGGTSVLATTYAGSNLSVWFYGHLVSIP